MDYEDMKALAARLERVAEQMDRAAAALSMSQYLGQYVSETATLVIDPATNPEPVISQERPQGVLLESINWGSALDSLTGAAPALLEAVSIGDGGGWTLYTSNRAGTPGVQRAVPLATGMALGTFAPSPQLYTGFQRYPLWRQGVKLLWKWRVTGDALIRLQVQYTAYVLTPEWVKARAALGLDP